MNKMKRILALALCLLLAITSLPVTQLIFAKENNLYKSVAYDYDAAVEGDIKETVTKNGRECTHYGRLRAKDTLLEISIDKDSLDSEAAIVVELPVVINAAGIDRIYLDGLASTDRIFWNKEPATTAIKADDWNVIKIEFQNVSGTTGKYYVNDTEVGTFTVVDALVKDVAENGIISIVFIDVKPYGNGTEEIWVDENNIKVTQLADSVVKFYDINDEVIATKTVADGGKVEAETAPVVEHYDFLGWYAKDASTAFDFNTTLNGNLDLYAKYEAKTYDVVFKANGETLKTLTGKYGDVVDGTIPEIPAKEGWGVLGWYIGDTEEVFNESTIITGPDMVVNAKYVDESMPKFTVTFNVDGEVVGTETVFEGYAVESPVSPTKEHYEFAGWTLNGEDFNFDTPIISDITLEAKFIPASYNVSFYNDKEMKDLFAKESRTYNTVYGELPVPTKAGHIFLGWKLADGTAFEADTVITGETSVYAEWKATFEVVLNEDLTKYTSLTGNKVEFITPLVTAANTYLDGGVKFEIVNSNPAERGFNDKFIAVFRLPYGEYDEANRTQVYNTGFVGDNEIEYTFDIKLSSKYTAADGTSVSTPFGSFKPGNYENGSFSAILNNRVRKADMLTYNVDSASSNSFNALSADDPKKTGSTTSMTYTKSNNVVVKVRYDSVTGNATMAMDGFDGVAWGPAAIQVPRINGFMLTLMNCFKNGDYINVKKIKVTRYDDYSDTPEHKADYEKLYDILDSLPVGLAEDPRNVTSDITLDAIDGVTWSTSNPEVINATTGEVTRLYNDEEVVITATVKSGIYSMTKEYELTVKKDERVEIKDIINQTFASEDTLGNWSFLNLEDTAIGNYIVDADGLKISKITSALEQAPTHETKRYFAFYDLYQEVASDDYSVTETKDLKGIYDVTVDMSKYFTSKIPMNVAIGCRDGLNFYNYGILKIEAEKSKFVYYKSNEASESVVVEIPESAKVTFRIDTTINAISLVVNGETLVDRVTYYTTLGENTGFNALKIELDSNNNVGDYINVKNITVKQLIKEEFTELENLVKAAADIDVYDITETPGEVSGEIKLLPKSVGNYKVVWTSLSNQIDVDTREVFYDKEATTVYVTAEICDENSQYPLCVKKTFELTVRKAANGKELDEFKISSLGKITNQDYDDIRYDLNLPKVDGITWKSSNESLISNDGKIVADAVVTKETSVTITALTENGVTKPYELKVQPRTGKVALAKSNAPVEITLGDVVGAKVSSDVAVSFTYTDDNTAGKVNVCDEKGNVLVSMVADEAGIHFDYLGSDYKKYDVASANVEIIVMPDVDKAAIFVDGAIVADYVSLKNDTDYVAKVESELNVGEITMSTDKYGMLNANLDNIDYFEDVKYGYANAEGLNLPENVITDSVVTWTSSNTAILSNKGEVTAPMAMTFANLTFTIEDAENSAIVVEKTFEIAVDCAPSKNIVYNKVADVKFKNPDYPQENLTDNNAKTAFRVLNANTEDLDIVFNLEGDKVFNSVYVLNTDLAIEDYEIYSSGNGESWHLIKSGNMDGKVSKLVEFENTTASYVKFVVKKCEAPSVEIGEIKVFFSGTDLELAQYDMDLILIDTAPTGSSIDLPKTGVNGTVFTWTTSDEDVIDIDGTITRPSSATTVKLTATTVVDGETLTKTFDVYVDTKSSSGPTHVGGGAGGGGSASDTVYGNATETEGKEDKPSSSTVYYDVKADDWYHDAVITLTNKGIISGDGSGNFNPTDNVTREQFVKMILEALEVELVEGENKFTDVEDGAWYVDYIITANKLNIVNGLAESHFGVGSNISRQDMAVLIERVLNNKEIEIEKAEVAQFADASDVSNYASVAVANMKAIGLIQGYNNNFNPKDNLTRAEAAKVIASLLELLAK